MIVNDMLLKDFMFNNTKRDEISFKKAIFV